jgi:hypothetical protein
MIEHIVVLLKVLSKVDNPLYMLGCPGRSYPARYTATLATSRDFSHITWSRNPASVSLLATECLVSLNKNLWRVHCWQKSQNQLSINREIINVHHVKDSIEHNLFYLDDQLLRLQFHSNSLTNNQTHFSLFTKNTLNETDVSRNVKILKELHKLELSKKSRYQTINFRIRFQRW